MPRRIPMPPRPAAPALARALACIALALALLAGLPAARADPFGVCDPRDRSTAAQQDRVLRFAAIVQALLDESGAAAALVSRSGVDLSRFGQRHSHAGLSLRDNAQGRWAVRQLYYDCEAGRSRLFDQGMAAFLLAGGQPEHGHVALLLLPPQADATLATAALDDRRALQVLHPRYSANAYAWGLALQNCNQWLAEFLGAVWSGRVPPDADADTARAASQAWLRQAGYEPVVFDASALLLRLAAPFIPWLHSQGHPAEDLAARRYRVHMPSSIEAFVRGHVPGVRRLELCRDGPRVVVREGWEPLPQDCRAAPGDRVLVLD
jgi:hypothetical protein